MDNLMENLKKGVSVALTEAEKISKAVKNKTVHIYDTTKLKLALNDTQGKLDKHYREIGEIIYKRYLDNRNVGDDVEALCEEIDEFMEEVNALKARIAELNNNSICPNCGKTIDKSDSFCPSCGTKLDVDDDVIQIVDVPDVSKTVDIVD